MGGGENLITDCPNEEIPQKSDIVASCLQRIATRKKVIFMETIDNDELVRQVEAAEAAAAATLPSAEEVRTLVAAAEALAASEAGVPPKSAAVILQLEARWLEFIGEHGEAYKFDAAAGPSLQLVVHFQTTGYIVYIHHRPWPTCATARAEPRVFNWVVKSSVHVYCLL